MWDTLRLLYEGTEKIKKNKLSVILQKFDSFKMMVDKSIDQLQGRFTKTINGIVRLRKKFKDKEMNMKIIRAPPSK